MKNIRFAFYAMLFLASCNSSEQKTEIDKQPTNQYCIEGVITNNDGETIFLSDSTGKIIKETKIQNNQFILSGTPNFSAGFLHLKNAPQSVIFLDSTTYNVRIWDNNEDLLLIESDNPQQIAYNIYQFKIANLNRKLLSDYESENQKDIERSNKQKTALIKDFIANNNNFVGLFELQRQKAFFSAEELKKLYASLGENLQETPIGRELKAEITTKQAESQEEKIETEEGRKTEKKAKPTPAPKKPERFPAPDFSGLSPEGYLISLKSVTTQHKITMLDFWGSWCQPCRMQNPFWVRLYRKYNSLGFTILSIAEETEESRPYWESAIQEDNMNWTNIIDENKKIAELYGAYALPHAVLIDQDGKIIYHKASARDIQEFLQDFFQK